MAEVDVDQMITKLLRAAQDRFGYERARLVGTAAYYAEHAHRGQERKEGGPYVQHPIRVAHSLVELSDSRIDVATVIAALLHDLIEDTEVTRERIEKQFGRDVASLVEACTHDDNDDKVARDQEAAKRVAEYVKRDPRVVLIKLMDQLDNAQSFNALQPERKDEKIALIEQYYIPLAERLELPGLTDQLTSAISQYESD